MERKTKQSQDLPVLIRTRNNVSKQEFHWSFTAFRPIFPSPLSFFFWVMDSDFSLNPSAKSVHWAISPVCGLQFPWSDTFCHLSGSRHSKVNQWGRTLESDLLSKPPQMLTKVLSPLLTTVFSRRCQPLHSLPWAFSIKSVWDSWFQGVLRCLNKVYFMKRRLKMDKYDRDLK